MACVGILHLTPVQPYCGGGRADVNGHGAENAEAHLLKNKEGYAHDRNGSRPQAHRILLQLSSKTLQLSWIAVVILSHHHNILVDGVHCLI